MPYQVNPTFSSGAVLSSAQLNILSENIEYLYSLISGVNVPFSGDTLTASGDSRTYTFKRQGRYIHYSFELASGQTDEVDIRIDGSAEYTDASNRSSPFSWSGYVDLQATTANPAVGDSYEIYVEVDFLSASVFKVVYFIESDSTTL